MQKRKVINRGKREGCLNFPAEEQMQEHQSYFKAEGNCQILIWDILFLARASVNSLSFERNAAWTEDLLFYFRSMGIFNRNSSLSDVLLEKLSTNQYLVLLLIFRYLLESLISSSHIITKGWCRRMGKMSCFYNLFSTKLPSH